MADNEDMETIINKWPLVAKSAYFREPITNPLRVALAVCSGRIPYIRWSELHLLGVIENEFSGYMEINDRVKEICEDYVYREIMHHPH